MIAREDIQEPTTLLRFFTDDQEYGDPYVAVMTLRWKSPDTVEALGFQGHMTTKLYKELITWFKDNGIKHVLSTRHGEDKDFTGVIYG